MARPDLGTKRIDPENGRKFYDLGKNPIISPYTGTSYPLSFFDPPTGGLSRRGAVAAAFVHREEKAEVEVTEARTDEDETVSLAEVEDDEEGVTKATSIDIDDDEADEKEDDDRILPLGEDEDEDVAEIIGSHEDDE